MADEVGSIIGYLSLDRSAWLRDVAATERDADRLGRLSPDIRINTNAASTVAQLRAVEAAERGVGRGAAEAKPFAISLIAALAAIAPAALPIAAVAGGAMAGLIPVAATLLLGVKGISEEFKSGALAAGPFGDDLEALTAEATQLKTIAASGLLGGIDEALRSSHGLFPIVNDDVRTMSNQIGSIVGGAGPALLHLLIQLNPLFTTFGTLVANGAHRLEDYSQSSTGVASFVAFVQSVLPQVMAFLAETITLFSHLAQAAAPFGGVILNNFTLLFHVLNMIPIPVLRTAIPVVIALYAAFKTYQGVTAIVAGVNKAIVSMQAPFTATAASAVASSAAVQAATTATEMAIADEAATIASAKAAEARAAATAASEVMASTDVMISLFAADAVAADASAAAITESWAGVTSLFATDATLIAEAAAAEAAAFEEAAVAATVAAEQIAAASTGAAETVTAQSRVAAAGWSSMLGPIGAVVIGVGLLATMFLHGRNTAQQAAAAADSYAESVKESTEALSVGNITQTNDNLAKKGALDILRNLRSSNKELGVSQIDLATAVNGTGAQYDQVSGKLKAYIETQKNVSQEGAVSTSREGKQAEKLVNILGTLRKGLQNQILTQTQLNQLNAASAGITDRQAVAAAALYGLHGTKGVAAYLAAQQAAQKNTESTKAQTLAFQAENNAAALVNQALQTMAGTVLGNAQAQTQLDQAVLGVAESFKTNGATLAENTAKGVANRQAIEGAASAMRAKMQAEAEATGSTTKATTQYRQNSVALLEQIGKLYGTKSAAYAYAKQLLAIPPIVHTKAELEKAKADADLAAFNRHIRAVNGKIISVRATVHGMDQIVQLNNMLLHLHNGKLDVGVVTGKGGTGGVKFNAAGTEDFEGGWSWVGDQGPELMRLPVHTQIKSNRKSVDYANKVAPKQPQGKAGHPVNVTINPRAHQSEYEIGTVAAKTIMFELAQ